MMILLLLTTFLSIFNSINPTPIPNSFIFLPHQDLNPVFVPINSTNNKIPNGQDQQNQNIQEQNSIYSQPANIQSHGSSYMNYSPDTTSNNFPSSVMDMNSMKNYMDRYINTINPLIQFTSSTLFSSIPSTLESSNISGQKIYYNNNINSKNNNNNIKSPGMEVNPMTFSYSNTNYPNEQIDYIDNMNVFKSDPTYTSDVLQNSNSLVQTSDTSETNIGENMSSMNPTTLIPNININNGNKNPNLEKAIVEQKNFGSFAHDTNNIPLAPVESTGLFDMKHPFDNHYNHNIQTLDPLERFEMETLKQFHEFNREAHQQLDDEQLNDDNNEANTIIPSHGSQPIEELISDHHSFDGHISQTTDSRFASNEQLEKNPTNVNENHNQESLEKILDSSIHRLDQMENSHLIQPINHPFYQQNFHQHYLTNEHLDHNFASSKTTPVGYFSALPTKKSRSLDKTNNLSTMHKPLTKHSEKVFSKTENPDRIVHVKEEFNPDGSLKPCDS